MIGRPLLLKFLYPSGYDEPVTTKNYDIMASACRLVEFELLISTVSRNAAVDLC